MKNFIYLLQNILMPLWQCLLNLLNDHTFMGVLLGGIIGYWTSFKLIDKKNEIEAKATLKAILAEIKTLDMIFRTEFAARINKNEDVYWYKIPLGTDYFPIYHSNTTNIGKIKNEQLRKLIIEIYMTAKYFLDCLKTNNNAIDEYMDLLDSSKISSLNQVMKGDYKASISILNEKKESVLKLLKESKQENVLPTYNRLVSLFEKLDLLTQKLDL